MGSGLLLSIFCIILVSNQVFSYCDETNGPPGITECVYSPQYQKFQAAVCMLKKKTEYSTGKHLTCKGLDTRYCWYQCMATGGHGGMSACQCDPNSPSVDNTDTPEINCYFPSGVCSWFSECLAQRKSCPAVTDASNTCQKLEKSSKEMSENGKAWVKGVNKCMQNDLVHLLYPQVKADCEKVKENVNSTTKFCLIEPLVDNHYCKLSWGDACQIDGFSGAIFSAFTKCWWWTTFLPTWTKQLLFYVENNQYKEFDTLANEIAETLSQSFQWSDSGVKYKSVGPAILPSNGDSIPIRIYLYSESKNDKLILKKIDELKAKIAKGDIERLTLKDGKVVKVTHVIGCIDPQCLSHSFFMQTDIGKYNCYGDVTKLTPSGRKIGGIPASINNIKPDIKLLTEKIYCYVSVGKDNCIHPAVIAAMASRESHAGSFIKHTNGFGDDNNAYGVMQCHLHFCPVCDKKTGRNCKTYHWNSCEHIQMMTKYALVDFIKEVQNKHPAWTLEQQLQGGIAAYNCGSGRVKSWDNLDEHTTDDDYSNDVIARAQYLISQHGW